MQPKNLKSAAMPALIAATLGITMWANTQDTTSAQVDTPQPVVIVRPVADLSEEVAPAASPKAELTVTAPKSAKLGELIEVDASTSKAVGFAWLVEGVSPDNMRIIDGGRRVLISADSVGLIKVTVAAALDDSIALNVLAITVTEADVIPVIPVIPVIEPIVPDVKPDTPEVKPEVKPGDFPSDLKRALDKVDTPRKAKQQLALSKVFVSTASLIDSGLIVTVEETIEATKKLALEAVDPDLAEWEPVIVLIEGHVTSRAADGKLKTVEDHAKLWRELGRQL